MWAIFRRCWLAAIVFAFVPLAAGAQEKEPGQNYFITDAGQHACADAAWIGLVAPPGYMNPWGVVSMRMLASKENVGLRKWQFEFNEVIPLNQRYLDTTVDRRPLPTLRFKELRELGVDLPFYMLLNEALEKTYFASQEQFINSGEENKHRHYGQLNATPDRFRGQVITAKGKLKVVRQEDTPRLLAQRMAKDAPKHIYTGWIAGPQKQVPPYTIVFLDLPLEIPEPSERLDLDVTFQGYFLGMVSFPSGKEVKGKKQEMFSPYLVGKTVVVHPPEKKDAVAPPPPKVEEEKTANSYYIIIWTVGGIVSVALLVAVLNVWFGRGDRAVKSRLAEMRDKQQPFNLEPADEPQDEGIKPGEPPG